VSGIGAQQSADRTVPGVS